MPTSVVERLRSRTLQLRAEWQGSALLRMGCFGIATLLWIYSLLLISDAAQVWISQSAALAEQALQLKTLKAPERWRTRAQEVKVIEQATAPLLWAGPSRGVVEAQVQDLLRTIATKTGHAVRDLRLLADIKPDAAKVGLQRLRVRMVVDFRRPESLALLAEIAQAEPALIVDRCFLQTQATTPVLELELHAMADIREEAR
jgi:hypothetical protein